MMGAKLIDRLGEWNPQLLRELKGRLKPRNIFIAAAISIVGQILVYLGYKKLLLTDEGFNDRYCTGSPPIPVSPGHSTNYSGDNYCNFDFQGHLMTLDDLWWLDIFTFLSVTGIFTFLVVGTYLLTADLAKEENQGTLNFIRLSPQSAQDIFLGKILGVPILLYIVGVLAIPFHLRAGLSAGIPLNLILAFYGVLIASCAFFYSVALLIGLVGDKLQGFHSFLTSGAILGFLLISTFWLNDDYFDQYEKMSVTPWNYLFVFNPAMSLPHLVQSTFLPPRTVSYFTLPQPSQWQQWGWYGQPIWNQPVSSISFMLLNFALWTYWIRKAWKRRFHNPTATLLSKSQSYGMTISFIVIGLGFVLQTTDAEALFFNYMLLQEFLLIFFVLMILAISPHRQTMQDWMRYRHLTKSQHRFNDLLFGEKSPAVLAVALNLGIVIAFLVPAIAFSPLKQYQSTTFFSLLGLANTILIYSAIAQWILLQKSQKRSIWAGGAIVTLISLPELYLSISGVHSNYYYPWFLSTSSILVAPSGTSLFSVMVTVLGQWTLLTLISSQMTRQLRKLGESSTKALLSQA